MFKTCQLGARYEDTSLFVSVFTIIVIPISTLFFDNSRLTGLASQIFGHVSEFTFLCSSAFFFSTKFPFFHHVV